MISGKIWEKGVARFLVLLSGLFMLALGVVITIESRLGVSPWDVFHLGVYYKTRYFSLGQVTILVGVLVIGLSYLLKVRPTVVTFLNMFFFGFFLDAIYYFDWIHIPERMVLRVLWLIIGTAIMGFGVATYMSANYGSGPRDSLMLGLSRRFNINMGIIRTILEVIIASMGYLLKGPLGIGTIIHALTIGISIDFSFRIYRWLGNRLQRQNLYLAAKDEKEV